jgi:hypothetical protein
MNHQSANPAPVMTLEIVKASETSFAHSQYDMDIIMDVASTIVDPLPKSRGRDCRGDDALAWAVAVPPQSVGRVLPRA